MSKKQFNKVFKDYKKDGRYFAETILNNIKAGDEDKALGVLSEYYDLPVALLRNRIISPQVLNLIPKEISEQQKIVIFKKIGSTICTATTNPENKQIIKFIERKTGFKTIAHITTPKDIDSALRKYNGKFNTMQIEAENTVGGKSSSKNGKKAAYAMDALDQMTQFVSTTKLVDNIIDRGISQGASDIHIESGFKKIYVRYRIDGILNKINEFPKQISPALVARIRILANLKIDEHMAPQDGRFHYKYNDQNIALRVSILPTLHGPKIVLRILEMKEKVFSLSKLGLNSLHLDVIKNEISLSQGIILATGPTGSGKTTTLYTILEMLNSENVNISTIEDPIEYGIDNINQTQIKPSAGLTFATGLKSLLRQDPDILMVGEIRDTETADISANAALTGHLVLSTLHTNNAFLAPQRFIEMGIQPYLVSSVLKIIIGQRLVRRLCRNCRIKARSGDKLLESGGGQIDIKRVFEKLKRLKLLPENKELNDIEYYRVRGCSRCGQTGYSGRVGIYEIFKLDDELRQLILKDSSEVSVKKYLFAKDTLTMAEDGLLKFFSGLTTLEEVIRVTKE